MPSLWGSNGSCQILAVMTDMCQLQHQSASMHTDTHHISLSVPMGTVTLVEYLRRSLDGVCLKRTVRVCTCSRTDSDGYGAFSPPSPGTPVTPRLGSGVGPAPGPTMAAFAAGGGPPGNAAFAGPSGFATGFGAGLTQPSAAHGAASAVRPLQVLTVNRRVDSRCLQFGSHTLLECVRKHKASDAPTRAAAVAVLSAKPALSGASAAHTHRGQGNRNSG